MLTFAKQSKFWQNFFSAMAESWKKQKTLNVFLSFIVYLNRKRSALLRDLLRDNSLFGCVLLRDVGQSG